MFYTRSFIVFAVFCSAFCLFETRQASAENTGLDPAHSVRTMDHLADEIMKLKPDGNNNSDDDDDDDDAGDCHSSGGQCAESQSSCTTSCGWKHIPVVSVSHCSCADQASTVQ